MQIFAFDVFSCGDVVAVALGAILGPITGHCGEAAWTGPIKDHSRATWDTALHVFSCLYFDSHGMLSQLVRHNRGPLFHSSST